MCTYSCPYSLTHNFQKQQQEEYQCPNNTYLFIVFKASYIKQIVYRKNNLISRAIQDNAVVYFMAINQNSDLAK